ncbi:reductase [Weissella bombi]|uniref:Riboflavin biosynthesis RibT protein n=1 Tax=Weissella bombi TaxID=1505725 RepID=A0A1C3Z467_9LACO|nr:reductase [Weissella bombi]SCB77194.1 riboflavin biosynthesis RibT protein [Weissella bombi]
MLVIVRKDQSKIVMGLLSYSPDLADIAAVQREYDWYQSDDSRDILLWRDEDTHHFTALLGVARAYNSIVIRHIVFSPEVLHRQKKVLGKQIYEALKAQYPDKVVMGSITTQKYVTTWQNES